MTGRVLDLKPCLPAAKSISAAPQPGVRLGKLLALAAPDGVWVALTPSVGGVLARLGIDCDAGRLARAIEQGQSAVLAFENGDGSLPIVLGIVSPLQPTAAPPAPAGSEYSGIAVEADADGRRVRLEAQEEVVLQCGLSSITLKRNGKVIIRGSYIETYASGTNRIKGGNVRIN